MARKRGIHLHQTREEILSVHAETRKDVDFPEDAEERLLAFEEYGIDGIGRRRPPGPHRIRPHDVEFAPPQDEVEADLRALLSSSSFLDALEEHLGPAELREEEYARDQYLKCKSVLENITEDDIDSFIQSDQASRNA